MSTQSQAEGSTTTGAPATIDQKLEVVIIPVADVDRAKRFYQGLGWRVDADFASGDDWRLVQLTPPGSPCSVMFGKGFTTAVPGSVQGTFLVVDNLESARAGLAGQGIDVSDVFHFDGDRLVGPLGQDRTRLIRVEDAAIVQLAERTGVTAANLARMLETVGDDKSRAYSAVELAAILDSTSRTARRGWPRSRRRRRSSRGGSWGPGLRRRSPTTRPDS